MAIIKILNPYNVTIMSEDWIAVPINCSQWQYHTPFYARANADFYSVCQHYE